MPRAIAVRSSIIQSALSARSVTLASVLVVAALSATLPSSAIAQPTNTTLPGGWSWQNLGSSSYDTGLKGTPRGGFNTQGAPPYNDTSFGVMNEPGSSWFTGSDLSAQQYVQRQVFGNFGTGSPPGPSGTRFYNTGFQSTTAGSNFPRTATERRDVSLNNWNNTNPDSGGVASFGQVVWVPTAATLNVGLGWGGDEMLLKIIGGNSGARSQFFVDATLNASFTSSAFGGISALNNTIRVNAVVQANDAGSGNYDVSWGYGASNAAQVNVSRVTSIDSVFVNGAYVGEPSQGSGPANSAGYAFTNSYNVLSSLVQNGSAFSIQYDASADINNLVRDNGFADARASMGPGYEGTAQLVVTYTAFRAIPAPGAGALLGLGGLVALRRKR